MLIVLINLAIAAVNTGLLRWANVASGLLAAGVLVHGLTLGNVRLR